MTKRKDKNTVKKHERIYIHIRKDVFTICTAPIWMPVLYSVYVIMMTGEYFLKMLLSFFWFWFAWMSEDKHYRRVYRIKEYVESLKMFQWLE